MNNSLFTTGKINSALGLSLLALAVSQANAGEPAKVKAGDVDITPTLEIGNEYNDNIYSADTDETSSNILVIKPAILAEYQSGDSLYSFNAELTDGSYSEESDEDYTDYLVGANADIAFNASNMLMLAASTSGNHEARGSGVTQGLEGLFDAPTEFDEDNVTADYKLGSAESTFGIQVGAGLKDIEYTNFEEFTAIRSYEKQDYGIIGTYNLSSDTNLSLEYNTAEIEYDVDQGLQSRDGDEDKILAGATWQATGNTAGTVQIGRVDREFDSASREDYDGTIWLAQVAWTPSDNTSVTVFSSQEPRETLQNGNLINGTNSGASWVQAWTESISTTVDASFGEDDYEGSTRADDTTNYGISLDYEFRRWLSVGLSYNYNETDSNFDAFDYDTNVYKLNFVLSL